MKKDLIPLHPPLVSDPERSLTRRAKGGNLSPPFGLFILPKAGKGRWPACAKPLRRRQGRDFNKFVSNR
ncbi:MAG: hypothetical protein A2V86_14085 [Deltaproteobacteria bacterium RBG_16_49_23]|nr:MAG: hypothetical protein A2V86_14085 [Deltaproteobacteria bacterium RBG_16_49_23]